MGSSASVALLFKLSELARRYGLRPSEADAIMQFIPDRRDDSKGHYEITFSGMNDEKLDDNFDRMADALGVNKDGALVANEFWELEDAVDRALSKAPRARTR